MANTNGMTQIFSFLGPSDSQPACDETFARDRGCALGNGPNFRGKLFRDYKCIFKIVISLPETYSGRMNSLRRRLLSRVRAISNGERQNLGVNWEKAQAVIFVPVLCCEILIRVKYVPWFDQGWETLLRTSCMQGDIKSVVHHVYSQGALKSAPLRPGLDVALVRGKLVKTSTR